MLFNILQYTYFKSDIKKTIGSGVCLYLLLILLSYSNHSTKIPYLTQIRKYFVHLILADITLFIILNRIDILNKVNKPQTNNKQIITYESDSESDFDPYDRRQSGKYIEEKIVNRYEDSSPFQKLSETDSDINLPIYK